VPTLHPIAPSLRTIQFCLYYLYFIVCNRAVNNYTDAISLPTALQCPYVSPKSQYECSGRQSHTCWSPGHPDTDCPGHGLCCSDGCSNVCAGHISPPIVSRTTPRTPQNPCRPGSRNLLAFCCPSLHNKANGSAGCNGLNYLDLII
jgi:hypothetical protein